MPGRNGSGCSISTPATFCCATRRSRDRWPRRRFYPREIIRRALELGATALILIHNHPSGDLEPSRQDIKITADIVLAANIFGIRVHDHVVITRAGYTSFRVRGFL